MKGFWKIYLGFTVFAALMFGGAWVCYEQAYLDPTDTDLQVSHIIERLDALGESKGQSVEQRAIVLGELLSERHLEFKRSLFGHLAEAFMLSGVMILTAEGLTRFITAREFTVQANHISANVWNAIFARLVPEQIALEVKKILKSDVCRVRPEYTITLERSPNPGLPEGHIIVRRELYYRIMNLTGGKVKYPISIKVLSHTGDHSVTKKDGSKILYPRICNVHERDTEVHLTDAQRTLYENIVTLPKMETEDQTWSVWSVAEEICTTTDRALYVLTAPCYGLELNIVNKLEDSIEIQKDNVYLTNGDGRLKPVTADRWACEGGILAGTALSLSWRAITSSS